MNCPTCGSTIRENATFCVKCGSKMTTTDKIYFPRANFLALRTIAFIIGTLGISIILGSLIMVVSLVVDNPWGIPVWLPLVGVVAGVLILSHAELILLFVNVEDHTNKILYWINNRSE